MKFLIFFIMFSVGYVGYHQQIADRSPNRYKFKYKSELYKGTRLEITARLRTIKNSPKYSGIPEEIQGELDRLFIEAKSHALPKLYKKHAIRFLNALYHYEKFVIMYNGALYEVIEKLKRDMNRIDYKLEREFIESKTTLDRTKKEDSTNIKEISHQETELHKNQIRLASHRWMKKKFDTYRGLNMVKRPDHLITEFKKKEASYIFSVYEQKSVSEIKRYLENQIIDFYYKKAIADIDPEKLELEYINRYNN